MNSMIKKAGLAIALGATALSAAAPVEAQRYGGYRGGYHGRGNVAGAALVGGLAGLAIGASLADRGRGYYYYDDGYYAPPPAYYYGPRYVFRGYPRYYGYPGGYYHGGYGYRGGYGYYGGYGYHHR